MKFNKIYVEITNICNLNCSFCSKYNLKKKEMSLQEFDKVLSKIRQYTDTIYLHVKGEPLLHSKLEEILTLTKKYKVNVRITTNGTLLKEKLNTLQKYDNIRQINVSLHSENNKANYFEDVFSTCTTLSKNIPIVYRIWLLDNYNLDKLSTTIVDKIIFYYNLDNSFKQKVLDNKNIKIADNIYLDKDNKFNWPDNLENNLKETGTCLGTRSHIGILVDGTIIPCCLDSKGLLKLGNIFTDDLDEIFKSKEFLDIHNGFLNNKLTNNLCKNCSFRNLKFK